MDEKILKRIGMDGESIRSTQGRIISYLFRNENIISKDLKNELLGLKEKVSTLYAKRNNISEWADYSSFIAKLDKARDIIFELEKNEENIKIKVDCTKIYSEILEDSFKNMMESVSPSVTYVIGQNAAGKSTYIQSSKSIKDNILIIPDEYFKAIHHLNLLESEEKSFIAKLSNEIENIAIDKKMDILVESTMFLPEFYKKEMSKYIDSGYTKNLIIVATPKEISLNRLLYRNEGEFQNLERFGVSPRIVPLNSHNSLVQLLPHTLRELEENRVFDNIRVISYTGEELYNSQNKEKESSENIFLNELNRVLSEKELSHIKELNELIISSMKKREAKDLDTVQKLFQINNKYRDKR